MIVWLALSGGFVAGLVLGAYLSGQKWAEKARSGTRREWLGKLYRVERDGPP